MQMINALVNTQHKKEFYL